MSDLQSHIIYASAKVIESAQSGYALKGFQSHAPKEASSQNLTLTVLAAKNNQILLEEKVSGKRLLLDKTSLQSSSNAQLTTGDKLVLVSSSQKVATFVVQKMSLAEARPQGTSTQTQIPLSANILQGQTLQNTAQALSIQWPDISPNILKKAQPLIIAQLQLAANTLQAKNLAANVMTIAIKTGQPILALNTNASVSFVSSRGELAEANKSLATGLNLNIDVGNRQTLALRIPLSSPLSPKVVAELKTALSVNQQVSLSIDINNTGDVIKSLRPKSQSAQPLSRVALREINIALSSQVSQLTQKLSPLLLSAQSPNLHSGITITPSAQNLQHLGASIKQQMTEGVTQQTLANSVILLNQSPQNHNKIQLSLVNKPSIIAIDNYQLAEAKITDSAANRTTTSSQSTQSSVFVQSKPSTQSTSNQPAIPITNKEQTSKTLVDGLKSILQQQGHSVESISTKLLDLRAAIASDTNQVLPRAESIGQSLRSVLAPLQVLEKSAGPELKPFVAQLISQIKSYQPSTSVQNASVPAEFKSLSADVSMSPDVQQIKDLLSTPALLNTTAAPVQAVNSVSNQSGLLNGLVTMLQASLQAKLIGQQPSLLSSLLSSPQFTQLLPAIMGSGRNTASPAKVLQDVNRLDPRSNLIGELNKVLSSHSLHKLSGAESTLQNQDTFYYTLPNMFSPEQKDIEIVIKREHQQQQEHSQQLGQAWQLSMKLDIGKQGEVLAKVKLAGSVLDLNLYASNTALKQTILDNLPHLNKRLVSLGLSVKPQCFVGKMPLTLHKTNYQVVQAYV